MAGLEIVLRLRLPRHQTEPFGHQTKRFNGRICKNWAETGFAKQDGVGVPRFNRQQVELIAILGR